MSGANAVAVKRGGGDSGPLELYYKGRATSRADAPSGVAVSGQQGPVAHVSKPQQAL